MNSTVSQVSQLTVPLSHLVPSKRNPRRVKPAREAHHRLVALIRSQGLLLPLLVRPMEDKPMEDKPKHYYVIAGHRRLAALREIHKGLGDPKVPCVLRDVDVETADALSLGENFGQCGMHPLDEAEAFGKLAAQHGKDAEVIAAEFGVSMRYVQQRTKLATLAGVVKTAYRSNEIDTATAEAFASVPDERQVEVWTEMNGHPRHAEHVRNIIAHGWIDAGHALFDVSALPDSAVSRDLFSEKLLIERQTFMAAQTEALAAEREKLIEEGWNQVVAGKYEEIHHLPFAMDPPEREFDQTVTAKLEKLSDRQAKWEAKLQEIPDDDDAALTAVQNKLEALEAEERDIINEAPEYFSETTKAVATAFLILDLDGQVRREYRVPRSRRNSGNGNGHAVGDGVAVGDDATQDRPQPPSSDDLADRQLATTFTHQALAVREALLKNDRSRKQVLALMLHDKVRSEALAIRHEANGTTLHASTGETFTSAAFDRLAKQRAKLDPFRNEYSVDEVAAYASLSELSASTLDSLIDLLVVDHVTAHMQQRTELVHRLAGELKVNIRDHWKPDSEWLAGYKKIQLSHLMAELRGPVYDPSRETRKKSELVEVLAVLFADAAEGRLGDKKLADRVNGWTPANLREPAIESI